MQYLTDKDIEYWAEEYRRLRYALPRGTTFELFLIAPNYYRRYAENRLRDWHDNPRVMPIAHHRELSLN